MRRLFRQKLLVGGVALLVVGSAGGAYAATQSGSNSRQAFLNDVAKRLNVSPSQLRSAVKGALLDRLQAAVMAGELTQAQADRIKRRIEQGRGLPFGPLGGGMVGPMMHKGFGPFGPGGRFGPGGPGRPGGPAGPFRRLARHSLVSSAASYLGVSPSQLLSDLRGGKSLAQIAQAQNKAVAGLEQTLMTAAKARVTALVSSGVLTKAQEQRLLNRLNAQIGRLVNAHPKFFKRVVPPPPSPSIGAPGVPPPIA